MNAPQESNESASSTQASATERPSTIGPAISFALAAVALILALYWLSMPTQGAGKWSTERLIGMTLTKFESESSSMTPRVIAAVCAGAWLGWSAFLIVRRHRRQRLNTLPLVLFVLALAAGCGGSGASEDKEKLRIEAALVGTWTVHNEFYSFGPKGVVYGYGIYQVNDKNEGKIWNLLEKPGNEKYEVDTSENPCLLKWITKGKPPRFSRIISLAGTNAMITSASEDSSLTGKTSSWMRVSSDPTFLSHK